MKKMNRLFTTLLAVALLGGLTACQSNPGSGASSSESGSSTSAGASGSSSPTPGSGAAKTVRIGFVDSGNAFPSDVLGIAIDEGYLEEELASRGYVAETIPFVAAGPALNEALVSNSVDIVITGDVPAVIGKSNGVDTTFIAGEIGINEPALMVPADSALKDITELKGKKVATLTGSYMHKVLVNMLEANGMTVNDIQFVNLSSPDAAAALVSGSVDAAMLAHTQYAALANSGDAKALLKGSDNLPDWNGSHAILAKTDYLKDNKDAAVGFLAALLRGNAFAKENKDASVAILGKSGAPAEAIEFLWPGDFDFNLSVGEDAINTYTQVNDFLVANKLTTKDVAIAGWADSTYYDEAASSLAK